MRGLPRSDVSVPARSREGGGGTEVDHEEAFQFDVRVNDPQWLMNDVIRRISISPLHLVPIVQLAEMGKDSASLFTDLLVEESRGDSSLSFQDFINKISN